MDLDHHFRIAIVCEVSFLVNTIDETIGIPNNKAFRQKETFSLNEMLFSILAVFGNLLYRCLVSTHTLVRAVLKILLVVFSLTKEPYFCNNGLTARKKKWKFPSFYCTDRYWNWSFDSIERKYAILILKPGDTYNVSTHC